MTRLQIRAPFGGWALPLSEVPDPAFASGMIGVGCAIDPTDSLVCAPCDGKVQLLPQARHALSIRNAGLDVLIHVGIDTVKLAGAGFELLVPDAQSVQAGEPLLRFDMDRIARGARSLVTPILISGSPEGTFVPRAENALIQSGSLLFEFEPAAAGQGSGSADARRLSAEFIVPFDHGLHARPAARLVACLKPFRAQVLAQAHNQQVDVRSTVALMSLGVRQGERLMLQASGPDAAAALAALGALLAPVPMRGAERLAAAPEATMGGLGDELAGLCAAPGLSWGVAARLAHTELLVTEWGADTQREREQLERALSTVRSGLAEALKGSEESQHGLIEAHLELLNDPQLHGAAEAALAAGKSAGFAWRRAIREAAATLQSLEDRRMRERAADLLDLEAQVLRVLRGESRVQHLDLPERAIVVADELLPSQLLALDARRLAGVCTSGGGVSSHVALLAAARGLPMLVALGAGLREVSAGSALVLDADRQRLETRPSAERLKEVAAQIASLEQAQVVAMTSAHRPARTLEGTQIAIYCNLGDESEVGDAVQRGAEGCGLLRSEFLFLDRAVAPDEEEQLAQYQRIATAMGERVLTIRTLDAGGDKPIAYLDLPPEENPALGLRGIRTSLWAPELLTVQLRAIVRVKSQERCRILLPMVTDVSDLRTVRAALLAVGQELQLHDLPKLGVMIETPASALLATQLCREADFLSIGTNDLAQYTLAMDRGQAQFANRLDALHPAVLALIAGVCAAAHPEDKEIAVCGGLASDSVAVPLLLGLGVRELSCVPRSIPMLKQLIRSLRLTDCRQLADKALQLPDARAVRALSSRWLEARGVPT